MSGLKPTLLYNILLGTVIGRDIYINGNKVINKHYSDGSNKWTNKDMQINRYVDVHNVGNVSLCMILIQVFICQRFCFSFVFLFKN